MDRACGGNDVMAAILKVCCHATKSVRQSMRPSTRNNRAKISSRSDLKPRNLMLLKSAPSPNKKEKNSGMRLGINNNLRSKIFLSNTRFQSI